MNPRILIFGSTGQLAVELAKVFASEPRVLFLSRRDADLADLGSIRSAIRNSEPQFVINAAAYTAVDRAESEPELARAINGAAPQAMAEEALRVNAWLLHFSTDYVFDGAGITPWKEADVPNPLNVYGKSKLEGEQLIAQTDCRHLIFRTSWVYAAHGNNFLRTMLRLADQRPSLSIVDDQIGSPTSADEIARAVQLVLRRLEDSSRNPPDTGVYHMTCRGSTSWFGFAQAIFARMEGKSPVQERIPALIPIPTEQYPTPAVRPRSSVLDCSKLEKEMGIRLAPWETALDEVIEEIQASVSG